MHARLRSSGTISTEKDFIEPLNFTAFYEALLETELQAFVPAVGHEPRCRQQRRQQAPRHGLSFVTMDRFNANLKVVQVYTAQLGLQPGNQFEIKLGRKRIKPPPSLGQRLRVSGVAQSSMKLLASAAGAIGAATALL